MNSSTKPTIIPEGVAEASAAAGDGLSTRVARKALFQRLQRLRDGEIRLHDNGAVQRFGARTARCGLSATITVRDSAFYSLAAFGGTVGAGESYIHGHWRCDDLTALVRIMVVNRTVMEDMESSLTARSSALLRRLLHWANRNSKSGSARNIAAHYDLGNDLYKLMLDDTMAYSCGIFENEEATLHEASVAKFDAVCRKLALTPSDHLVEIGTGWGGLAIHAAEQYGCRVTTTTISREQHDFAQARIAARGLKDRVTLLFRDYRDLDGQYDKLVSIEMIEAVGAKYLDTYFAKCSSLLKPTGAMLLQAITLQDQFYARALKSVDYIQRFIFPGSFIPSVNAITASVARVSDMKLFNLEDIGPHYAPTLRLWRERFFQNIAKVRALGYPESFNRLWEFYLCYCEGGFAERQLGNVQMLLTKPDCRARRDRRSLNDAISVDLHRQLRELLGANALVVDAARIEPLLTDHRGLYHGKAAAVVEPPDTAAVARLLAWCNLSGIPVVPQGGNTGYCGGATPDTSGTAILLSLRLLNRIRSVDPANFAITVEAGCTLAAVQTAATSAGRLFPLSLGSEGSCQIGGNLATNAGGTAVLRYGMMRDMALGIEAVLADGSVITQLSPLRKDNTGYDLRQLLIGSEGTLGVITAACLRLFPQPRSHATAWVALPSPAAGLALLALLRERSADRLSSCELVPREALRLVLEHLPGARDPGVIDAPWNLLVELDSSGDDALDVVLESVIESALADGLALDAAIAQTEAQRDDFWRLRESVPEAQRRAGGSLKHDIAVPVASVAQFIEAGAALVTRLVPEGFLVAYGHLGDGNLHFNVNQRSGADRNTFLGHEPELKRAVHDLVASFGGSFSAEHGIGQLKVRELERYADPAELSAMRRIKQALDPNGILNPGKVLRSMK